MRNIKKDKTRLDVAIIISALIIGGFIYAASLNNGKQGGVQEVKIVDECQQGSRLNPCNKGRLNN